MEERIRRLQNIKPNFWPSLLVNLKMPGPSINGRAGHFVVL